MSYIGYNTKQWRALRRLVLEKMFIVLLYGLLWRWTIRNKFYRYKETLISPHKWLSNTDRVRALNCICLFRWWGKTLESRYTITVSVNHALLEHVFGQRSERTFIWRFQRCSTSRLHKTESSFSCLFRTHTKKKANWHYRYMQLLHVHFKEIYIIHFLSLYISIHKYAQKIMFKMTFVMATSAQ